MPRPLAPTARSSSRSSKTSDPSATADTSAVAVGQGVGAHAMRGLLRMRAYQPRAPSLVAGGRIVLERDAVARATTVVSATPHGRGLVLLAIEGVADRTAAEALVGARVLVDV